MRNSLYFTLLFSVLFVLLPTRPSASQVSTATPAPAILATATPIPTIAPVLATPIPSNTPFVGIQLEALERANVRSAPDVNSERLGEIVSGELYPVLGRFFRWIQFEYRLGPAWVFEELVIIHGDTSQLLEINLLATPEAINNDLIATLAIITQTPGGLQTATSQTQPINAPTTGSSNRIDTESSNILPTFTFPAQFDNSNADNDASLISTPAPFSPASSVASEIPPILPIAVLAGIGILGFLLWIIRR